MTRSVLALAVLLASVSAHAGMTSPLRTEHVRSTIDDSNGSRTYKVDSIDINLTKEDLVRAKNWHLLPEDWAKYKYIMKYTPRGTWTPNLDPLIVLGNYATTDSERLRYAQIMNALEADRQVRELKFEAVGQKDVKENYTPKKATNKGKITQHLPDTKRRLKSIFVDLNDCNDECLQFVRQHASSYSSKDKIDLFVAGSRQLKTSQLYKTLGVSEARVRKGDITISQSESHVQKQARSNGLPVVIVRTDEKTNVLKMD